jgi:Tfp pilus assembly protein PilX
MPVTLSVLSFRAQRRGNAGQRGVVLIIAPIVLVAMTLTGVALMRSTTGGNKVAGNLAFRQSAMLSADAGVEAAIGWLEANSAGSTLFNDSPAASDGYRATRGNDPAASQSWEAWWQINAVHTNYLHTQPVDAAGNTVSYIINRLCNGSGSPSSGVGCSVAPAVVGTSGSSKGSGVLPPKLPSQQYYRITARVSGPKNTVSFVQVVVAI